MFSGIPPWNNNPLIATMGAASLATIFTTPPTPTKGDPDSLMAFLSHFDFDRDAPKIYAKGDFTVDGKTIAYPESAWDFMTPPDADNPAGAGVARAAGHKIIVYHGQSDGVFSFEASANWIEKLDANSGGDAGGFARLFAVPGMNHCSKGPATDNFDMLSAISLIGPNSGVAPDAISAEAQPRQQGRSPSSGARSARGRSARGRRSPAMSAATSKRRKASPADKALEARRERLARQCGYDCRADFLRCAGNSAPTASAPLRPGQNRSFAKPQIS